MEPEKTRPLPRKTVAVSPTREIGKTRPSDVVNLISAGTTNDPPNCTTESNLVLKKDVNEGLRKIFICDCRNNLSLLLSEQHDLFAGEV